MVGSGIAYRVEQALEVTKNKKQAPVGLKEDSREYVPFPNGMVVPAENLENPGNHASFWRFFTPDNVVPLNATTNMLKP